MIRYTLAFLFLAAACSSHSRSPAGNKGDLGAPGGGDASATGDMRLQGLDNSSNPTLTITPANSTLNVQIGQAPPTLALSAVNSQGAAVTASWQVDRGDVATITDAGVLAATGSLAGVVTVTATANGLTATTKVTVQIAETDNGGSNPSSAGAGGYGGVGGAGFGGTVDQATLTALGQTPSADSAVTLLYPYTKTVWPRGLLAPLLQWSVGTHHFTAVSIQLSEDYYTYKGTFASNATPFQNHPLTQGSWQRLCNSNHGEAVTVTLTFVENGVAYGPLVSTWKIASAPLTGTVYYNSYGTQLATQETGVNGEPYGGATLAIKPGETGPRLIAGASGNVSQCRVCHTVAANGNSLITQQGASGYDNTSRYDLQASTQSTVATDGSESFAALYPDGSLLFTQGGQLRNTLTGVNITTSGLPTNLASSFPAFSPDGTQLAYMNAGGDKSLVWWKFDGVSTFSASKSIAPPDTGTIVFPAFTPDGSGLVFELETRESLINGGNIGTTIHDCTWGTAGSNAACAMGAQGELWYTNGQNTVRLANLNGVNLPTSTTHQIDDQLNYEPTVNTILSGGYAWVVFTSRRLYGNVATVQPYASDPASWDTRLTPTTKKLWVAAIDLNAPDGMDPSAPAFYLPGQELYAGNSRGYWVVDPCHADGLACDTGAECCGGYCRAGGDAGALTCESSVTSCANVFEHCTTNSDCCNAAAGYVCINQHCSEPPVQ